MTALRPGTSPPPGEDADPARSSHRGSDAQLGRRAGHGHRGRCAGNPALRDGRSPGSGRGLYDRAMNYELFMGEALAEAQLASARGERPDRRGRRRERGDGRPGATTGSRRSNDPTAHAVDRRPPRGGPKARHGAARRRDDLRDPRAVPDVRRRAARERRRGARVRRCRTASTAPPARSSSWPSTARCRGGSGSCQGIRRDEAEDCSPPRTRPWPPRPARDAGA